MEVTITGEPREIKNVISIICTDSNHESIKIETVNNSDHSKKMYESAIKILTDSLAAANAKSNNS